MVKIPGSPIGDAGFLRKNRLEGMVFWLAIVSHGGFKHFMMSPMIKPLRLDTCGRSVKIQHVTFAYTLFIPGSLDTWPWYMYVKWIRILNPQLIRYMGYKHIPCYETLYRHTHIPVDPHRKANTKFADHAPFPGTPRMAFSTGLPHLFAQPRSFLQLPPDPVFVNKAWKPKND